MQPAETENLQKPENNETQKIRDKNGKILTVPKLSRTDAIKYFCVQCLGFGSHPDTCEVDSCPLFPYRGKVLIGQMSEELRQKLSDNAKKHGFGKK